MDSNLTPLLIDAAFRGIGPFPLAIRILSAFSKKYSIKSEMSVVTNEAGEVKLKFYFSKPIDTQQLNELMEGFVNGEQLAKLSFTKEWVRQSEDIDVLFLRIVKEERNIAKNMKEKSEKNL